MVDVFFDNVLQVAWDALLEVDVFLASCRSVTLIRDVQGKITLFVEPAAGVHIDRATVDETQSTLSKKLGPFFANDIWISDPDDDVLASLERTIRMEREQADWLKREKGSSLNCTVYILERRVAKEYWRAQGSLDWELPWSVAEVDDGRRPAIITFYSFKGGQGRTTALAAVGLLLARRGFRVGMIDLDLEAPGLGSIFFPDGSISMGVIDYLINKPVLGAHFTLPTSVLSVIDRHLIGDGHPIRVIPAGHVNSAYLEKLARLDFQHQMSRVIRDTMQQLLTEFADAYDLDVLFIDSRAGFHDLGGLAMTQLSHAVVLLGNQSRQTWAGLVPVIQALSGHGVREPVPVVLVHAMAPGPSHVNFTHETRMFRETAYDVFQRHYYPEQDPEEPDDIAVPNENDPEAPFHPVVVPWNENLRADLRLLRMGEDDTVRVKALVGILTSQPYTELAERLTSLFNRFVHPRSRG
ncbi:KGGVGR-motif variant AAA ATPase [Alicyclobacillus sendaiensis]|uniref:KGGVGR-motif variant AAA ATPase n=1 Tax=Alicyclobacillus sendaiensis TaxID=192387 RepID=UPI000783D46B|nr:hypothetical protein [Alicyclobacillus sendaiensis]